jgi:hypothetical protein
MQAAILTELDLQYEPKFLLFLLLLSPIFIKIKPKNSYVSHITKGGRGLIELLLPHLAAHGFIDHLLFASMALVRRGSGNRIEINFKCHPVQEIHTLYFV